MDIDGNPFRGGIPPELGNLAKLTKYSGWAAGTVTSCPAPSRPNWATSPASRILNLYEARFDGSIPEEFGNLTELEVLRITGTNIDGGLSESLGALEKLRAIRLYDNQLSDPLPSWIGQLDSLFSLWVSDNNIEGRSRPASARPTASSSSGRKATDCPDRCPPTSATPASSTACASMAIPTCRGRCPRA